jgi:hypothetical protein
MTYPFLQFIPILDGVDFEFVRRLYNENLAALSTKPLREKSLLDQIEWFIQAKPVVMIALNEDAERVGFFALTPRLGGYHTPIFVIDKPHRGKLYARRFIHEYLYEARTPLAGSQLISNTTICRLNKDAGWVVVGEKNGVQYLYHPGDGRSHWAAKQHAEEEMRKA